MTKGNGRDARQTLEYGRELIPFELSFSERKRLTIHVDPDQRVRVLAPMDTSIEEVMARLQRRAGWISRQRLYFEEFSPPPRPKRFVEGETHRYLGRQYRLKYERGNFRGVRLRGRFFCLLTPEKPTSTVVKGLLTQWYREHAERIFLRRLEECLSTSYLPGIRMPPVHIRTMKTRWGSCAESGTIILNLNLVKSPLDCIEYVIMHELCHLKVHDHSRKYYDLLAKCMPDWERRKNKLNAVDWNRT